MDYNGISLYVFVSNVYFLAEKKCLKKIPELFIVAHHKYFSIL